MLIERSILFTVWFCKTLIEESFYGCFFPTTNVIQYEPKNFELYNTVTWILAYFWKQRQIIPDELDCVFVCCAIFNTDRMVWRGSTGLGGSATFKESAFSFGISASLLIFAEASPLSGDFKGGTFETSTDFGVAATRFELGVTLFDFDGETASELDEDEVVRTAEEEAAVDAGVSTVDDESTDFFAEVDLSVSWVAARRASRGSIIRGFSTFSCENI